jgi:hypothetical protein
MTEAILSLGHLNRAKKSPRMDEMDSLRVLLAFVAFPEDAGGPGFLEVFGACYRLVQLAF